MADESMRFTIIGQDRASDTIGKIGQELSGLGRRLSRLSTDSAPAFDSLAAKAGRAGSAMGQSLTQGLSGSLRGLPALLSNPYVAGAALAVAAIVAIPAAALVAAASLAGLGLGFLALGAFAVKGNAQVQSAFGKLTDRISATFKQAAQPLVEPLVNAMGILGDAVEETGPALKSMFADLAPVIEPLAHGFAGLIKEVMPGLGEAIAASAPLIVEFADSLPMLGTAMGDFLDILATAAPFIGGVLTGAIAALSGALYALGFVILGGSILFGALKAAISTVGEAIGWLIAAFTGLTFDDIAIRIQRFVVGGINTIVGFMSNLDGHLARLPVLMLGWINTAVTWASDKLRSGAQWMVDTAASLPGRVIGAVWSLIGGLANLVGQAMGEARNGIANRIGSLASEAGKIPGRILSALGNLSSTLYGVGLQVVQGLINGLRDKLGALQAMARNIANAVKNTIKGALDINSPSRVMHEFGEYTGIGFANGLHDAVASVQAASIRMADSVTSTVPASTAGARIPASYAGQVDAPIVIQLDSRQVWQGLLRLKLSNGGMELGLA